jgi:hypothetical protein
LSHVVHRQFRGIFEDREPPSPQNWFEERVGVTVALRTSHLRGEAMKNRGITTGGIIVILGIILIIVWSFWIGLIVTLIGLIAFGGFARGKWY